MHARWLRLIKTFLISCFKKIMTFSVERNLVATFLWGIGQRKNNWDLTTLRYSVHAYISKCHCSNNCLDIIFYQLNWTRYIWIVLQEKVMILITKVWDCRGYPLWLKVECTDTASYTYIKMAVLEFFFCIFCFIRFIATDKFPL